MAKSVVNSGLSARCLVQLSYAIGVAKPLSLFVETYGSEKGSLTVDDITKVLKTEFDCRPGAIAQSLALREPKYQETAAYCHFGREPVTKDGIKFFEWENPKDLAKYKTMSHGSGGCCLEGQHVPHEVGGLSSGGDPETWIAFLRRTPDSVRCQIRQPCAGALGRASPSGRPIVQTS